MDKSPFKIKEMFNSIASAYDRNNMLISFGLHKRVKKLAIKLFNQKGKVLDLCTGTGDIAGFLSKTCDVIGLDFSPKMIEIARKKHPDINFIEGDCTNLPFEDNSFDGVTISFGLRNIEDYEKALDEICRVLKVNGKFLHLDFGKKNVFANIIYNFIVPKLVKLIYKDTLPYEYLVQSKKLFFDDKNLIKLFEKHNLKLIKRKTYLFGAIACQICEKV